MKIVPRIVSLLSGNCEASKELKDGIISEAINIFINISTKDRGQASCVVEAGAVPLLVKFVADPNSNIRLYVSFFL